MGGDDVISAPVDSSRRGGERRREERGGETKHAGEMGGEEEADTLRSREINIGGQRSPGTRDSALHDDRDMVMV